MNIQNELSDKYTKIDYKAFGNEEICVDTSPDKHRVDLNKVLSKGNMYYDLDSYRFQPYKRRIQKKMDFFYLPYNP